MVYANDEWVQVPVMQLYDTGLMQSAIQNARYMYEKAEKRMDDFYDKYGEFMSPFQRDMDRYNQIVGDIKSVVDNLYATGEDPLRTASGRAKMAAALRSVNPAEFAAMKANAKMGYAYLDAAQKLRSSGKYSEAQELFDIMQNHGKTMGEFATYNPDTGTFNTWDRSAPIEAISLRDLTQDAYKGRTARILTQKDFSDPRLAGYKYDPRYEWSGYLYSDLLKNAPGASLAIAGDPRAAFFRDKARQMVIARGEEPTAAAVEKQFQRNIADANTWALIDPSRKADDFAKMATQYSYNRSLQNQEHKNKMDEIAAQKGGTDGDGGGLIRGLATDAASALAGFNLNSVLTNKRAVDKQNKLEQQYKDKKITKQQYDRATEQNKVDIIKTWMSDKNVGGGKSIIDQILSIRGKGGIKNGKYDPEAIAGHLSGDKSRRLINNIIGNFATNGSVDAVREVLRNNGYIANDEGLYKSGIASKPKIITAHQLFMNILKQQPYYEIRTNGGVINKNDLIKRLDYNQKHTGDIWNTDVTNADSKEFKIDGASKNVIMAPDENGTNHLYVMVEPNSGWGDDKHGFWLQLDVDFNRTGSPTADSKNYFQASEEYRGHSIGNTNQEDAWSYNRTMR